MPKINHEESEETEVKKDKQWAIKETKETINGFFDRSSRGVAQHYEDELIASIADIINQLDEPDVKELERKIKELDSYNDELIRDNNQFRNELDNQEVLSEEWIDEHLTYADVRGGTRAFIRVEDLQDLLVLKWEEVDRAYKDGYEKGKEYMIEKHRKSKPVIPKFVAEYLDFAKSDVPLMRVMELANTRNEWAKWKKEYDWISANDETFARAWLDGFTVEEEQKYYVLSKDGKTILLECWGDEPTPSTTPIAEAHEFDQFTEQEIKDYDERYWAFAVKVEDLEE